MKKSEALPPKIHRLNYIGSKFQLLQWLTEYMKEKTGFATFENKTVADLFAGTGVVSHHFRQQGATVYSNDAELYSSVITHAFTRSVYTERVRHVIDQMNAASASASASSTPPGFVTRHYSPFEGNERMFFTVENARRIDMMRTILETAAAATAVADALTHDEYQFILASIIISADAVSNVPAVYGCYLKNFKAKATKPLVLFPIHTITASASASVSASASASATFHADVTDPTFLSTTLPPVDIAYLDPPYNERQYSKNYFPLNIIAKTPASLNTEPPLKGKTGIPTDCFLSPFCRKGAASETAFDTLIRGLRAKWIFLSYNSESIVSKEKMLEILSRYGTVSVIEREYKRFKSFEYNEDKAIQEYLFCLEKKGVSTDPAAAAAATTTTPP